MSTGYNVAKDLEKKWFAEEKKRKIESKQSSDGQQAKPMSWCAQKQNQNQKLKRLLGTYKMITQ